MAIIVGQAPLCEYILTSYITYIYLLLTILIIQRTVRAAFTKRFWVKANYSTTGRSSSRPSKPGSIPINNSHNDAFEMSKGRGARNDYKVTILSTRDGTGDGDSTDRIIEGGGIVVDSFVEVESESIRRGNGAAWGGGGVGQLRDGHNQPSRHTGPDAV